MIKRVRLDSNLSDDIEKDLLETPTGESEIVSNENKKKDVQYRINRKGEKRIILFSIPLVSLILFIVLIYLLSTEIYSSYDNTGIDDVIQNFELQISKEVVKNIENQEFTYELSELEKELNEKEEKKNEEKINSVTDTEAIATIHDGLFDSQHDVLTSEKVSTNNYVTSSGERYHIIANLEIPSLDINYPILSSTSENLLKISLTKYWGADPNEIGNMVVLGHNYESKRFFSKLPKIQNGAKIKLTDMKGRALEYTVYNTQIISPYDNSCTSQLTDGHTEITLITCYNRDANRFVVKARAN